MASKIYGYARISTRKQSIERQIRNIQESYPTATIIEETYTGTKVQGRDKFERLLKIVKAGDTIVFDSVSRMSREAEQGLELYMDLYEKGVNLVFLKEPYINTDVYKQAEQRQFAKVGNKIADMTTEFCKGILMEVQKDLILKAFQQAEKEVQDLRKRTSEGLVTAKLNGKQVGNCKGTKLVTKKSIQVKQDILELSRRYNGTWTDTKIIEKLGIHRNTFYKYIKELEQEQGLE